MQDEALKGSFLNAMRRLAATVCVVTCQDEGERYGMAATAVTSLSLDPVSLLVCINRSSDFHRRLTRAGAFCVNLLADTHTDQSRIFGSGRHWDERFKTGVWSGEAHEPPVLTDAQASIICATDAAFDYGSHTIVVGLARRVSFSETVAPLIYLDREVVSMRELVQSRSSLKAPA
jgi:flavin reductase (DIM6/NTAB) family NADH-FMN oxidoreductase RutF